MSASPRESSRVVKKKSIRPSWDRVGAPSAAALLMGAPRLKGVSQSQVLHLRWEAQMSFPPSPPGRLETKYRVRSSGDKAALTSISAELTTGPRLTGSVHPAAAKCSAWTLAEWP